MASNQDVIDAINEIIGHINQAIAQYTIPGILVILIGFGLLLLALTYLPYIVGILILLLILYLAWQWLS